MTIAAHASARAVSTNDAFQHYLEFSNEASELVSRTALSRDDFRLAIYAAQFERFQRDPAAKYAADLRTATIVPKFIVPDQPLCSGFSVTVNHADGDDASLEFEHTYFAHRAKDAVSQLVREGRVTQGAKLVYTLAAYDATDDEPSPADGIVLSAPAPQLTIRARPRATWGAVEAWDEPDPAFVRPGRFSRVVRVSAPSRRTARGIFIIYLGRERPLAGHASIDEFVEPLLSALYAPRGSYGVVAQVRLSDNRRIDVPGKALVSGAMLEEVCTSAAEAALDREADGGTRGITHEDLQLALQQQLRGVCGLLTPANVKSYVASLPQDAHPVSVEIVHRELNTAAA